MKVKDNERLRDFRQRLGKVIAEITDKGLAKMRKRHAGFTELVKEYRSFDDFMRDWYEMK